MQILPYDARYQPDFFRISMEWLEKHSLLEPEDTAMLNNIESMLAEGAGTFCAVEGETVLAVGMIHPLGGGVWELCKLGTAEAHQGKGAGTAILRTCMQYAENHGAEKVILVSNHVLQKALQMYEKFGFRHVPLEAQYAIYETADVQMEYRFEEGDDNADRTI